MCDYCDCRSEPEIASLSAEHDRLVSLLRELPRAAAELQSLLDQHAAREEQGVFAQLRAEVGDAYVDAFAAEHELIDALLAATRAGDVRAAGELDRTLRDHIMREESDLFPAAHQLLSPAQWDAVAASGEHLAHR